MFFILCACLYLNLLIPQCIKKTHLLSYPGSEEQLSYEHGVRELDLSSMDLSELDVYECLYPLLPDNSV